MKEKKIIFIGTPLIASKFLENLIINNYNIVSVVTQNPTKKNRGMKTYNSPVYEMASKHKIEVNPYVGLITKKQNLVDNDEIEKIFTVPLEFLTDKKNAKLHKIERKNRNVIVPSWVYNDQIIWGLTAMITADFVNTCFDASIEEDLDIIREQYDY